MQSRGSGGNTASVSTEVHRESLYHRNVSVPVKVLVLSCIPWVAYAGTQSRCSELPGAEQHALDVFFSAQVPERGAEELLLTEEWKQHDGRTSTAMLALLKRLRNLKREGVVSGVVAFAVSGTAEAPAIGEKQMALALLSAAERKADALVIALTGNLHAFNVAAPEYAPYALMASFLPAANTISLAITDLGGQAWNCQDGTCGPHTIDSSGGATRGLSLISPASSLRWRPVHGVASHGIYARRPMNRARNADRPAFH